MNVRNLTLASKQATPVIRHTSQSAVTAVRELVPGIAARAQIGRAHV